MKDQQDIIKVEISHKTIIFTVLFLLGLWFLVLVKEIIILIIVAILLLAALLRPVEWLVSKKIPRVLAVILVYAVVIAFLALSIRIIIPPLIEQSVEFANRFPQILASVNGFLNFHQIPINNLSGTLASSFQNLAGNIIKIGTTVFSSLFLIITIFVMTFYLLLDWRKFVLLFASPFSGKQEKKVINIISKVEVGLGRWVRG